MAMSKVYSQLSGHKWYVYVDKSLFISRVLYVYPQEMFLVTKNVYILTKVYSHHVEDCRQVDKIKMHNVFSLQWRLQWLEVYYDDTPSMVCSSQGWTVMEK